MCCARVRVHAYVFLYVRACVFVFVCVYVKSSI